MADYASGLSELFSAFAKALRHRSESRASIFEVLIKRRFEALHEVHGDFHKSLIPVDVALRAIEMALRDGKPVSDDLVSLDSLLSELHQGRQTTQPERRALHAETLSLLRSGLCFSGLTQPLRPDERTLMIAFMSAVCAYFETHGRYEHHYGTTLGALISRTEAWRLGYSFTGQTVSQVRLDLARAVDQMTANWSAAAAAHGRLEACLRFDLQASDDPPGGLPALTGPGCLAMGPSQIDAPDGAALTPIAFGLIRRTG